MGCALAWTAVAAHGQEAVVNAGVPVSSMSLNDARAAFGMRLLEWPDGQPVRVFVLDDDDPVHKEFVKKVLQIFPYQLRQSWDRLVFSGTGQAPQVVASQAEMLSKVGKTPGAIGYVKRFDEKKNARVRALTIR